MTRLVLTTLIVLFISASCGNTSDTKVTKNSNEATVSNSVAFASLAGDPESFVGKTITVEGKVVHVCMHSGKKMFITGENPDLRLYIEAGENMPKFPMELLGSEVSVEGTIAHVAAAGTESQEMHAGELASDTCETEKALALQPALSGLKMVYSKHEVVN